LFNHVKTFAALAAIAALSACTAQDGANFVSGAKTVCTNAAVGIAVVSAADPAVLAHNTKVASGIVNGCAVVEAIPAPAPAP
jgi:hypothetical protein